MDNVVLVLGFHRGRLLGSVFNALGAAPTTTATTTMATPVANAPVMPDVPSPMMLNAAVRPTALQQQQQQQLLLQQLQQQQMNPAAQIQQQQCMCHSIDATFNSFVFHVVLAALAANPQTNPQLRQMLAATNPGLMNAQVMNPTAMANQFGYGSPTAGLNMRAFQASTPQQQQHQLMQLQRTIRLQQLQMQNQLQQQQQQQQPRPPPPN